MSEVHVVVPEGVDDPARPSGGNVYDRRLCHELAAVGWRVREHQVPGSWPAPSPADLAGLGAVMAGLPDAAVVLVDGLVASAAAPVLVPEARRARLVVLVHMPLGETVAGPEAAEVRAGESAVLSAAAAVVASSPWTRARLHERYALPAARVHVAEPGVDPAEVSPGTPDGGELLCVAAVAPHKGHDVLLAALARLAALPWTARCVGSLEVDPGFVEGLRKQAREEGLEGRVRLLGALGRADLEREYAGADLLVLPSRGETYGMVVTEALAHGLPVVASHVGGLPETLGRAPDGTQPGALVPPDDPAALAEVLRRWLADAALRRRLRGAAAGRRLTLAGWRSTAVEVAGVLENVA